MNIAETYKRWRHTRGYGVHSPFAFRMIREVLEEPRGYSYYGYETIDVQKASRREKRKARMLLRLVARLDVGSVYMNDKANQLFTKAVTLGNLPVTISSHLSMIDYNRLVCTRGDEIDLDTLVKLLERPGRIIAIQDTPEGWTDILFENLDEGLMFYGKRNAIIISRPDMEKVKYSVRI